MSQNDLVISNQNFPSTRADINSALQALGSTNSGSSAPPITYANMMWYDTAANILKVRSEANDVWINIGYLDQSLDTFKILDDTVVTTTAGATTGLIGDQSTATWETGTGTTESLVSPAKVKASVIANAPPYSQPTTLGDVGTYAFLARTATGQSDYISAGSTYSGSSLTYAGVSRSSGNNVIISPSGSPSGTWRAMGNVGAAFTGFNQRATSFVRIS